MTQVGVKALKDRLSEYLRRAQGGERIVITDRGAPLALLAPLEESEEVRKAWELVASGLATWSGRKFTPPRRPAVLRPGGKTASEIVLEDRR